MSLDQNKDFELASQKLLDNTHTHSSRVFKLSTQICRHQSILFNRMMFERISVWIDIFELFRILMVGLSLKRSFKCNLSMFLRLTCWYFRSSKIWLKIYLLSHTFSLKKVNFRSCEISPQLSLISTSFLFKRENFHSCELIIA